VKTVPTTVPATIALTDAHQPRPNDGGSQPKAITQAEVRAEQDRHQIAWSARAFRVGDGVDSALFHRHG
jgi:hypothetical protein